MNRNSIWLAMAAVLSLLCGNRAEAQTTFGISEKFNDGWLFKLDSIGNHSAPNADDSAWRIVDLPHDWSIEGPAYPYLSSCTGYRPGGIGWYRKHFIIPQSMQGKKLYVYFDGVYCNSEVWINGHRLGYRPNGYVPFIYDLTGYVDFGNENVLAVKVDHSKYSDSRWYTGSGIYRDVYIVSSSMLHIDNWGIAVSPWVTNTGKAEIAVETVICNETDEEKKVRVEHRLYDKDGYDVLTASVCDKTVPAKGKAAFNQSMTLGNPKLWSIDSPELYRVETSVYDSDGNQTDGTTTVTGIRTVRFDPDKGFFLNGENLKMKGVCLHHDAGSLGAVVPEDVWRRRLATLKTLGVNAIRMSHNPQSPVLYDLCDEMGFLVMDEAFDEWEFPKKKWVDGWNVGDSPALQGYSDYFDEWAERDLATMVLRDRNHPSIVMWSIGNEVDYPNDPYSHPILDYEGINQYSLPGYRKDLPRVERIGAIAERLVGVVRGIDTTRAVTGAMAGVVMSNHTDYPYLLDVTGYNYTENRYAQDHASYPERIIYGSETRHEYPYWQAVRDNDFIFGQFLWTGIDYLGEAGPYPSRGFICGLMDLGGFVRPRGYYRQSLWSESPVVYAGTIKKSDFNDSVLMFDLEPEWNYEKNDTVRVAVFTNCESVTLSMNGKDIKESPEYDSVSNAMYWDVVYEPGELVVKGLDGGKVTSVYRLETYGKPEKLYAFADRQTLSGEGSIAHIEINIIDENGNRVLDNSVTVSVDVRGAGKLLKIENADPYYMGDFDDNTLPAYRGRLLAYVEATETAGSIHIRIRTEDGLETRLLLANMSDNR